MNKPLICSYKRLHLNNNDAIKFREKNYVNHESFLGLWIMSIV